ncbi:hypothetical protein ACT3OH_14925 [Vreelandella zhanjiangensis]|uniref:hypothetical protein n=1 Tax=Vreelandella zhanjiangensis TaxID=1121960 RepID=UPI00402B0239
MTYQPSQLYYSNPDHIRGARVSRDMMVTLCGALGEVLDDASTRHFISNTRIPNERELYGTVIKALLSDAFDKQVGHIATEVQVTRQADEMSGKGRVDIVFDYRRTSFLVELKVIRVPVNGRQMNEDEENATLTQRLVRPWQKAVSQLRELESGSLGQALQQKIVKLPMAIYLHIDNRQQDNSANWQVHSANTHQKIVAQLNAHAQHDVTAEYHFSYFQPLINTMKTSRRKGCLVEGTPDVRLYGFSLIAGMPIAE